MKIFKLYCFLIIILVCSSAGIAYENNECIGIWPVKAYIEINFGEFYKDKITNKTENAQGLYLSVNRCDCVKAFGNGEVSDIIKHKKGYEIIIVHPNNIISKYQYLSEIYVKKEEKVKIGKIIGLTLNTKSKSTEMYFEVRKKGEPIDPTLFIFKKK